MASPLQVVQEAANSSISSISDPCRAGTYRKDGMTTCQFCEAGKVPNTLKTTCGTISIMMISFDLVKESIQRES